MPYLPIDPQDIGRNYEAIIRVNSQSGKGGAAWVILRRLELDLPRGLQIEFSHIVQKAADEISRELEPREIIQLFENAYHLKKNPRMTLIDYNISFDRSQSPAPPEPGKAVNTQNLKRKFTGIIEVDGEQYSIEGRGNGALSAFAVALKNLGIELDVHDYKEHAIGEGKNVKAATFIECTAAGSKERHWGVGIHQDVVQASLSALLGAASASGHQFPATPLPKSNASQSVDIGALESKANQF
ncbi:hypothetical protein KEM56_007494 [Ascosphaera pollenicola]|nr:hypothetical protein KEM56_007494 [Ascosphaera pollenicola]